MMKVRLHDVVRELEEERFKLSVKADEGDLVTLVVTNVRSDGSEDLVATLKLHNNVIGSNEEWVFWEQVGLYWRALKAAYSP